MGVGENWSAQQPEHDLLASSDAARCCVCRPADATQHRFEFKQAEQDAREGEAQNFEAPTCAADRGQDYKTLGVVPARNRFDIAARPGQGKRKS
jgi:hypothetical protein